MESFVQLGFPTLMYLVITGNDFGDKGATMLLSYPF